MLLIKGIGLNLQTRKVAFEAASGHLAPFHGHFGEFVFRNFGKVFSVSRREA
jgi:hypothetical protein